MKIYKFLSRNYLYINISPLNTSKSFIRKQNPNNGWEIQILEYKNSKKRGVTYHENFDVITIKELKVIRLGIRIER